MQTKTPAKNLEADFPAGGCASDSTKPTWTYARKETAANKNAENLKTHLLKNTDQKLYFEKRHC